jgi:monoterpene epsilon-lactone hydrolase
MADDEMAGALHVPARVLPAPKHLSPQAQGSLSANLYGDRADYPPLEDKEAWRRNIAATDAMLAAVFEPAISASKSSVREWREGEALAYDITPEGVAANDRRVYLDVHGGGLINGAGKVCLGMSLPQAERLRVRTVSVDYRMPPDHPYPAGLEDCLAIYRALLRDREPHEIIIGGGSAGGNLAAALILKARDLGLPLPVAAVLGSPEVDLSESGDSFLTNMGVDSTLRTSLMPANLLYADGHDLTDPYVSPLFGDFTKGFPPTMITGGTRDLFLSNAVRLHRALRAAGVHAELHLLEAAPHGSFGGASPEEAELNHEVHLFCERWWGGG